MTIKVFAPFVFYDYRGTGRSEATMNDIKIAVIGAGTFLHESTRRSWLMSVTGRAKRILCHQNLPGGGIRRHWFREEAGLWRCMDRQCRFEIHSGSEEDSRRQ